MSFKETAPEWADYRAIRKGAKVRKSPVMDTMFGTDQEDIDRWEKRSSIAISEIDDLAPNASIVLGISHLDIIWYLDEETEIKYLMEMGYGSSEKASDGYHPGLFIVPRVDGLEVVSTCYLPSDSLFAEYEDGKMMSADELKDLIRRIESHYSGHFLTPRGIPVDYVRKSVRKSIRKYESAIESLNRKRDVHLELYARLDNMLRECDDIRRYMLNHEHDLDISGRTAVRGIRGYEPYFEFEQYVDGMIREVCNEINYACMNIEKRKQDCEKE